MGTQSTILPWRIPSTEEPGELQSVGSQRVIHDWADNYHTHTHTHTHTHKDSISWEGWKCFADWSMQLSLWLLHPSCWKHISFTFITTRPWSWKESLRPSVSWLGTVEPGRYCVFNRAEENITAFNSIIQTQCSSLAEIITTLQVCRISWQTQDHIYKKRLVPSFSIFICCCLFICLVCRHLFEDKLCQAPKV